MILKLFFFFSLFFLIGKGISKIFNFFIFSILETSIFGMFFIYLTIIIFSLFEVSFKFTLIFLICLSIIIFFYLVLNNFKRNLSFNIDKMKKLKNINKVSQLLIISLGISFIFLENFLNILSDPLSAGDALAVWYYKAKYFIHNPGIEYFRYINYPNFISSLWSVSLYLNYENFNDSRIILPFILFIIIITVYQKFIKEYENFFINSLLLFLVLIFYSTTTFGGSFRYSNAGYADFAVSVLFMAGFIYLYFSTRENFFSKKDFFFGCFCLSILPSIKNEGFVLSLGFLLVINFIFLINFFDLYKKNIKTIIYSIIFYFAMAVIPILFSKYLEFYLNINVASATDLYFSLSNLHDKQLLLDRFPLISKYFYLTILENKLFIILFILLLIFNIFFSMNSKIILQFVILISLFCIFYIYIIYFATKLPLQWHLVTSMNRIFFPFMGVICGLSFFLCNFRRK